VKCIYVNYVNGSLTNIWTIYILMYNITETALLSRLTTLLTLHKHCRDTEDIHCKREKQKKWLLVYWKQLNMKRMRQKIWLPMYFLQPLIDTRHVIFMLARKNSYLVPIFILRQAYITSTKIIISFLLLSKDRRILNC
jgi:hypothetical protein